MFSDTLTTRSSPKNYAPNPTLLELSAFYSLKNVWWVNKLFQLSRMILIFKKESANGSLTLKLFGRLNGTLNYSQQIMKSQVEILLNYL